MTSIATRLMGEATLALRPRALKLKEGLMLTLSMCNKRDAYTSITCVCVCVCVCVVCTMFLILHDVWEVFVSGVCVCVLFVLCFSYCMTLWEVNCQWW